MTLAIALTINAVLIAALLGGLAYAMSLPRMLASPAERERRVRDRRVARLSASRTAVAVGS